MVLFGSEMHESPCFFVDKSFFKSFVWVCLFRKHFFGSFVNEIPSSVLNTPKKGSFSQKPTYIPKQSQNGNKRTPPPAGQKGVSTRKKEK